MSPARPAAAAAVLLLLLPAVASAGPVEDALLPPSEGRCLGGSQRLYCVDATASADVTCTVTATHYDCTVSVAYGARGWTQSGLPGEVTTSGMREIAVCDGTDCTRQFFGASAPCSWAFGEGECSDDGSATVSVSGPWTGCFEVYADVDLFAYVALPGPRVVLEQDFAAASDSVTNC